MASITLSQVEHDVAQLAIAALVANEAQVVADLNSGESAVIAGLGNLLKNLPAPAGIFGSVVKDVEAVFETQVETYVQSLIKTYGGQEVFNLIVALIGKI